MIAIFCCLVFLGTTTAHLNSTLPAHHDASDSVIQELSNFVRVVVERAIQTYSENQRSAPDHCFSTTTGRELRARCCVFFSNIAAALIHYQFNGDLSIYGMGLEGTKSLDFSDSEAPSRENLWTVQLTPELLGSLLRFWATNSDTRSGIYAQKIKVKGTEGTLIKCEVSTVHTFLKFIPNDPVLSVVSNHCIAIKLSV